MKTMETPLSVSLVGRLVALQQTSVETVVVRGSNWLYFILHSPLVKVLQETAFIDNLLCLHTRCQS